MYLVPYETASPIQDLDLFLSGLYVGGGDVTGVFILGCHNGIMCLTNDVTSTVTIVIINPATREFRILSQPLYEAKHNSFLAFTYDPKADDYKVIRFCTFYEFTPFIGFYDYYDPYYEAWFNYENYHGDPKVQIYDLSTDSWRETNAVVPKYFPTATNLIVAHLCPMGLSTGSVALLAVTISISVLMLRLLVRSAQLKRCSDEYPCPTAFALN